MFILTTTNFNRDLMKKLFVLLISIIFLLSSFASVMATTCNKPSVTRVEVGDTFTIHSPIILCESGEGYLELVSNVNGEYTYKALKPGKVNFCCGLGCCVTKGNATAVTIVPKEYPFASFMKILGLGKKD
jgi:hypothetical protein